MREPFHTPANQTTQSCLSALLTQSLSARLAEADPRPLLVCLNSSMETAQVIWNSGMREELVKVGIGSRVCLLLLLRPSCCWHHAWLQRITGLWGRNWKAFARHRSALM